MKHLVAIAMVTCADQILLVRFCLHHVKYLYESSDIVSNFILKNV